MVHTSAAHPHYVLVRTVPTNFFFQSATSSDQSLFLLRSCHLPRPWSRFSVFTRKNHSNSMVFSRSDEIIGNSSFKDSRYSNFSVLTWTCLHDIKVLNMRNTHAHAHLLAGCSKQLFTECVIMESSICRTVSRPASS
jgi:hypothetical protein